MAEDEKAAAKTDEKSFTLVRARSTSSHPRRHRSKTQAECEEHTTASDCWLILHNKARGGALSPLLRLSFACGCRAPQCPLLPFPHWRTL